MKTAVRKRLYEAMFLVDSAEASSDWDGVVGAIEKILAKADCEVVSLRKWDDRRLAYDINGKSRGTYVLCYLNTGGLGVREIERAVQLSERIMRVLILRADLVSQENMDKETPAMMAEKLQEQTNDVGQERTSRQSEIDEIEHKDKEPDPEESTVSTEEA